MLSIFPDLFIYNFVGITVIRMSLGFLGVYLGFKILSKKNLITENIYPFKIPFISVFPWLLALLFIISGGFLIIGLFTQIACIILAFLLFKIMILDFWSPGFSGNNTLTYFCLILISVSLLFLGAGAFSFDLPF